MTNLFLILEDTDGTHQQELLEDMSLEDAQLIAKEALEDAPITYIYPAYNDDKYGLQPATHLDYIIKFE